MKRHRSVTALAFLVAALVLAGCGESPETQLASAKAYLQKNDTKAATIQIKNALQAKPELGEARYLLGTILMKDGNPSGAEIELRKALAAKYDDNLVIPELARAMLTTGQSKQVVEELGVTKLSAAGATANLQTTLSIAYSVLGQPVKAKDALGAALAADPAYPPALLVSARQKAATSDFEGALVAVDQVIAKDGTNADAWKLKGDLLLFAKGDQAGALVAYRKSVEAEPTYTRGYVGILTLLLQQRKVDEASTALAQMKKIAPEGLDTKYFEAQLALAKKDYKRAGDLSQELLARASNNPRVLQLAGAIELQTNSLAQAEVHLLRALQVAPAFPIARQLLIMTYLGSGQPAKALATLNEAIGKNGLDPGSYSLAGEVYLENGDSKKAEEYFGKALQLDPSSTSKRTAVALTHLASGQSEAAFDELQIIASSGSDTTADLALVSAHLQRKEYDKALNAIDKLEAKQPDKPLAASLRGQVQLAQNDALGARKSFERALAIDPTYFSAASGLATLDMVDKKPDQARKRYEALLAKNPKNVPALLALARIADASGASVSEVVGLLSKAIDANPNDVGARQQLVDLYLRVQDYKQATSAAQAGLAALPNSGEMLETVGRAQQASGDFNQAIATFRKLIDLKPLSPGPRVRLAEVYVANKDEVAAWQNLREALDIRPDMLEAQRGMLLLALSAKRYPDALEVARTVQRQRPQESAGFMFEGDTDAAQQKWDAAAAAYRAGLQRAATTDLAVRLYSLSLNAGKASEAEAFATAWSKEHPKDAEFYVRIGDSALARKSYPAAEKAFQSALRIQPDIVIALNNMAWVTGQLGKDGAIAYAEKAVALAPNQPAFMDTLAMLLADKKDFGKAIEIQRKALELQPKSVSLRLNLAKIYIKAGDKDKAKTELEALTKLGSAYPEQGEVTGLLKNL